MQNKRPKRKLALKLMELSDIRAHRSPFDTEAWNWQRHDKLMKALSKVKKKQS